MRKHACICHFSKFSKEILLALSPKCDASVEEGYKATHRVLFFNYEINHPIFAYSFLWKSPCCCEKPTGPSSGAPSDKASMFLHNRHRSRLAMSFFFLNEQGEVLTQARSNSNKSNLKCLIGPLCLEYESDGTRQISPQLLFYHVPLPSLSLPHFSSFPLISPSHSLSLSYDHEQFIKNVCLWGEVCS